MRKAQIAIGIVVALAAFAAADFYLNNLGRNLNFDSQGLEPVSTVQPSTPEVIPSAFKIGDAVQGFKVMSQVMTSQVFDKVDLGSVKNIRVVKTQMEKVSAPVPVATEASPVEVEEKPAETPVAEVSRPEPLTLYEIVGPKGQGALTYLAIKLQFVAQINATTETINEDGKYGDNSFFYNDQNLQSSAFLMTQIGDSLYGLQYNKKSSETYESVKGMIQQLTQKP
jgi:hypothetical protein